MNAGREHSAEPSTTGDPRIACRGVWKLYGPDPERFLKGAGGHPSPEEIVSEGYVPAVRDASFEVYSGEILIVMGLSGSGKSTLVRCLSRLIEPTAGEILVDGQDLARAGKRELIELRRHKMGMVFQHFALFPHRSVMDNVAFPLEVRGMSRAERRERAQRVIDLVGLGGREHHFPRELSGGQQQRVGIARSLAVEPDIWFLDEPFSALDPLIRHEMQDEFLRLQGVLNKTIVFITHDFDEAIRLADRIAIMNEGEIVQMGTAEEIVTRPADKHVAEFTRNVPRHKILHVRSIMAPPAGLGSGGSTGDGPEIQATSTIAEAMPVLMASESPVAVVDGGVRIGSLTREQAVQAIFGGIR